MLQRPFVFLASVPRWLPASSLGSLLGVRRLRSFAPYVRGVRELGEAIVVTSFGGYAFGRRRRRSSRVAVAVGVLAVGLFSGARPAWAINPPSGPCPPAPQMTAAPVLSPTGNQAKTQLLTTTQGTWTGCNTPFTKTQQWYWSTAAPPNGTENAISGATATTFTPTTRVGDYITVIVLVCDTQGVCSAAHSQDGAGHTGYVYVPPAPSNPSPAPTLSPSGGQSPSGTLFTAAHGTWSSGLTISGYSYEWFEGSTQVGTATTYTSSCSTDAGKTLTLKVAATNADGTSAFVAASNSAGFVPCNTVAPTMSPSGVGRDPTSPSPIQSSNGTWLGSPTSFHYEWFEGSTQVGSASTYPLHCSPDGGQTLTLKVAASNANGTSAYVAASNSASFIPCNTTPPTVTPNGTGFSAGQSLSAANGAWIGATSFSYAWSRDGTPISGATASSYTTTTADVSHCISVTVTATNSSGSASMTSNSACIDDQLGTASAYTLWSQPIDDRESISVNVGNGNLLLNANDLQLAGLAGFDLNFPRSYNSLYSSSQDLAASHPANGWQTVPGLHVSANGDVWFMAATGAESAFVKNGGAYTPPAGVDAQLAKNADGSFTLTYDGSNEQLNFNSSGVLQSDVDSHGNTISYSSTGGQLNQITDSLGHATSFSYNGSGQLTTITDPGNRTYRYGYDASGNLASFTDPTNATTLYGYGASGRLTQITDPDGNMTKIDYDAAGRVSTVTRGLDSNGNCPVGSSCPVTSFLYAQPGGSFCPSPSTETDLTDPKMHATRYCYDNQLRVTGTMDPLGYTTSTSFTGPQSSNCADNQPCTTQDADGNTTASVYQSASMPQNLTSSTLTSAQGTQTATQTASYNASNNSYLPSSSVDPNGNTSGGDQAANTTSYAYNSSSDLTSETDPSNDASTQDAPTTTYTYDSQGRMQTQVSPDGNVAGCSCATAYTTNYAYYPSGSGNETGLLESVTGPDPDGPTGPLARPVTTFAYDSLGRKTSEVDPRGNVSGGSPAAHTTSYSYDGDDRLLTETDQLGHTTTYSYDGDGNQLTVTDGNNNTTTSTYNALNQLTKTTKPDPDGSGPLTAPVTTYTYDLAGNKESETDPNNHTTSYGYDADNRLSSQTDALGNETTYTYDGNGNLLTTVDPRGNVAGCQCAAQYTTTDHYDDTGRLLTTTDPLSHTITYTYDANGNKKTSTDANTHQTTYSYYPSGLIQSVTAPDGGVTTYTYDADGNKTSMVDPRGNVTGCQCAAQYTTLYTYDYADELTSVTTPLGNKTIYTYDPDGNKATMVDGNGNASGANAAAHTTTYGYDAANRLTSIAYGDGTTGDVTLSYDAANNRTGMSDTGDGTLRQTTYSYDNDNQLLSSTRGSDTFTYTYDPAGNITSRTYPNGTTASYAYNQDEQLSGVTSGSQTTSYSYYPNSELHQTTLPNGYIDTRTYDQAGRLTEVNNARSGSVLSDFTDTLDPVGNPTKVVQTGAVSSTTLYGYDPNDRLQDACYQATVCNETAGSSDPYIHYTYDLLGNRLSEARPTGTTSYAYNADNELCATSTSGTASCANPTYSYDHNGNETQAPGRTFSYDLANRLTSTTNGTTTTNYIYDGDGNRVTATAGATTTNYLWDTNNTLPQLALERDGNGTVLRGYIYGIRRISMNTGGNPYYYLYDALGSVVNLTSSTGATEWTYSYEPFGGARITTQNDGNAPANPMQFTGEFVDSSTGLYDLRARQYDSADGRFVSRDPVSAGQSGVSSYIYGADDPTTLVDPSGETPCKGPILKPDPVSGEYAENVRGPSPAGVGNCPPDCDNNVLIARVRGRVLPPTPATSYHWVVGWSLRLSKTAQRAAGYILHIRTRVWVNGHETNYGWEKTPAGGSPEEGNPQTGVGYLYHGDFGLRPFRFLSGGKSRFPEANDVVCFQCAWTGNNGDPPYFAAGKATWQVRVR